MILRAISLLMATRDSFTLTMTLPWFCEMSMTSLPCLLYTSAKGANKTQVRLAVEEIFGVKVEQVNILNCKPKTKRMGKYVGKTSAVRKAVVKLPEGQDINLFSE